MRALRTFVLLFPVLCILSSCDSWMGEKEAPPLPGQRISVLTQPTSVEADIEAANLTITLPRPYSNKEWPQPGGYPDRAMHHLSIADNPKVIWNIQLGSGSDDDKQILSTPVVARGRIFTMDADGHIFCVSTRNGSLLWRFDPRPKEEKNGFGGGLAYSSGRIFVSTGYGEIIALRANSGQLIWRKRLGSPFRAAPVVAEKKVFAISLDNQLWALDGKTGQSLWNHSGISESAGLIGNASPAVAGDIVLAPYSSGEITALRIENGRTIWSDVLGKQGLASSGISTFNDINGSPVIDRGLAFAISHGGHLVAINIRSGLRVWEQDLAGLNNPWVAGDYLYIVTTEGEVVCLIRDTGSVLWVQSLPRYADPEDNEGMITWSGPLLLSDRLVLTSSAGVAITLSPYDGSYLGRVVMPDSLSLPPVVANNTIFVLTDQAELFALR